MKYKVGDKVKIRSDLEVGKAYGHYYVTEWHNDYKGKTVTIDEAIIPLEKDEIHYTIKEDNGAVVYFTDEMIEGKVEDMEKKEMVNHPSHYNQGKYEVIDVIEDWNLNFNLGNAVKYIARCDFKGKPVEDLQKAVFYLNHEIERRKDNG